MKDVTIIVTTFERPEFAIKCVESIRQFYPNIIIVISDNGKGRPVLRKTLGRKYKCQYLGLPFDCGASRARNEGFKVANTKYVVLCEDDFRFTEETRLESLRDILETDPALGMAGGACLKNGNSGIIGSNFTFDREKEIFYRDPVRKPDWKETNGTRYYYCDYIRMFFMTRNIPELYFFDEDFSAGGNHTSGLIEIKIQDKWRIAYVPDVNLIHDHSFSWANENYIKYRSRRRQDWGLFYKKTGFRFAVFDRKRVRDHKQKVTFTYPEFKSKLDKGEF